MIIFKSYVPYRVLRVSRRTNSEVVELETWTARRSSAVVPERRGAAFPSGKRATISRTPISPISQTIRP